jgi:hypothetical protein
LGAVPATSVSVLSRVPGLGEATCVQDEPCQRSMSVSPLNVGAIRPTAQASVAENALTSFRKDWAWTTIDVLIGRDHRPWWSRSAS